MTEAGSSSWDRFGARLGDMRASQELRVCSRHLPRPFLNSVFENPLFDRVFGETEQLDMQLDLELRAKDRGLDQGDEGLKGSKGAKV